MKPKPKIKTSARKASKFRCYKCGGWVQWRQLESGKVCPENLDGSDHWDECRERRIKNDSEFRKRCERIDAELSKPRTTNFGKRTEFYAGEIPPWDGSLGEFREL